MGLSVVGLHEMQSLGAVMGLSDGFRQQLKDGVKLLLDAKEVTDDTSLDRWQFAIELLQL